MKFMWVGVKLELLSLHMVCVELRRWLLVCVRACVCACVWSGVVWVIGAESVMKGVVSFEACDCVHR